MATPNDMPQNLVYNTANPSRSQNLPYNASTEPGMQLLSNQSALAPTSAAGMNVSESAAGLYVDPTPAFQPVIDFIGTQRNQANERYAQNKADIANIFGNLTQVNRESQARVQKQFETSIADQAMNTAQRMAEARMGAQQTQQSAVRAMDERGGGPMGNLNASPAAVASERAVGDIGAYGTIFEGQQRAIQAQTQQDIEAGIRGLGQQELFANQALQRSLEDTLNQLSGQETGIRGELAGAVVGAQGQVAQANYNEILAEKAAAEARRLAAVRGAYDVEQAKIEAQNKLDLALANGQNRVQSYQQNSAGVTQFMRVEGANDEQIGKFWASVDSVDISDARNSNEAYQRWLQANTGGNFKGVQIPGAVPSAGEKAAARLYFDGLRYSGPQEDALLGDVDFSQIPNTGTTRIPGAAG